MINPNIDVSILSSWEFWEMLKNEPIYFNKGTIINEIGINEIGFWLIEKETQTQVTLEFIINSFIQNGQIQEYEKLKEENKILKKRIQELTKYKEFSEKFTSLEPKKRLKVTPEEIEKIKELRKQGVSVTKIAKTYGVTVKTIYNYLKR